MAKATIYRPTEILTYSNIRTLQPRGLPADSIAGCGRGCGEGRAADAHYPRGAAGGARPPPACCTPQYSRASREYCIPHLYWNWCSLLRGTMPSGATPSRGGIWASVFRPCFPARSTNPPISLLNTDKPPDRSRYPARHTSLQPHALQSCSFNSLSGQPTV